MSSNPFRRSLQFPAQNQRQFNSSVHSPAEEGGQSSYSHTEPLATSLPPKTKKSVRISSPPESPDPASLGATNHGWQRPRQRSPSDSPSPVSDEPASYDGPGDANPFDRPSDGEDGGSTEDEEVLRNTRTNSGLPAGSAPSGAIPNPFQKTLATMEGASAQGPATAEVGSARDSAPAGAGGAGMPRGSMDVDAFKRLLMTGSAAPQPAAPALAPIAPPASLPTPSAAPPGASAESSSNNTDTSSVSRQSIFEPVHEAHADSPRTSNELYMSEDDRAGLVGGEPAPRKPPEKKKPPPPKPRHGKLVQARTPQTVSFSDFSTGSTGATGAFQPTQAGQQPPVRQPSLRSKPLPPIPPPPDKAEKAERTEKLDEDQASAPQEQPDGSPGPPTTSAAPPSIQEALTPPHSRRAGPPVPLARRQSQLRYSAPSPPQQQQPLPLQPRSRSSPTLTTSSQTSDSSTAVPPSHPLPLPAAGKSAPPPPPPARRTGGGAAANTSITTTTTASTTASPPPPAAPRSRSSTLNTPVSSPTITPSTPIPRTNQNLPSTTATTTNTPPPGAAAPLPPPRRRSSAKSSLDAPRPSRRSLDEAASAASGTSTPPLPRAATGGEASDADTGAAAAVEGGGGEAGAGPEPEPEPDILGDLTRFQAEVDELRRQAARQEGGGDPEP